MMKKIFIPLCIFFVSVCGNAQTPDSKELYETAKTFMKQRDFPNATLVLNRALQLDPQNIAILKDLALCYYFQKDNNKAIEIIKPVLERDDADDQCFQIAGSIYKDMDLQKECEKIYKKGIKKFPESGALYNELGELLQSQNNTDAIKEWEKGIEQDPAYSRNYYNAAKFYFLTTDKVWSIIYGEVFINMEPSGSKTPEIKELLLESYKKLFTDVDLEKNNKDKNSFVRVYLESMNKQTSLASMGLNTETLTMIRTRFILDWSANNNNKFPYQLFDYQRQLLQEGMFDAYNQWIFGPAQNLAAFQNWITTHNTEYNTFSNFQKGRVFKMKAGQYYH
jgi:tetratricopeptide (TPR) repeat protein